MDEKALSIVEKYIREEVWDEHPTMPFDVYIVWKCKTLQNWKWLISSTIPDDMYYEVTYSGDKREFYLDAYEKQENVVIKDW